MDDKAFGRVMTSFRGERTWVWTAEYKDLREALDRISAALVQAGYSHQPDNAAPGHRNSAEVAECVEMALRALPVATDEPEDQCERALQPLREALGMPARPRAELAAAAVSALRALEHSSAALARISTALTATGREADTPAAIADAVEEALLDHLPDAPADGGDCGGGE